MGSQIFIFFLFFYFPKGIVFGMINSNHMHYYVEGNSAVRWDDRRELLSWRSICLFPFPLNNIL